MNADGTAQEVWSAVRAMNRLWTVEGRPEQLAEVFAPEMIAVTPTDVRRREGRQACVAGWTEFVRAASIQRWEEKDPLVLLLAGGRIAVVAYDYELDCEMGGQPVHFSGRDMMTLELRDGRWWVVADHFSPTPAP